jgi:3-oxoacyl-[acyl-carrier protein] reductase
MRVEGRLANEDLERYAAKSLLKRLGEPRDIANAVLFLGSDESAYITGEILSVSGAVWPAL